MTFLAKNGRGDGQHDLIRRAASSQLSSALTDDASVADAGARRTE